MNLKQLQRTRLTKNRNFYRTGKCGINEFTRQVIVAPSFSHPWRETSLDSLHPLGLCHVDATSEKRTHALGKTPLSPMHDSPVVLE